MFFSIMSADEIIAPKKILNQMESEIAMMPRVFTGPERRRFMHCRAKKCSNKNCKFMHAGDLFVPPVEHAIYIGEHADRVVPCFDWNGKTLKTLTFKAGDFLSTRALDWVCQKYSDASDEAAQTLAKMRPRLCFYHTFSKAKGMPCPHMHGCTFLHASDEALAKLRELFCPQMLNQENNTKGCRASGPDGACPYAHTTREQSVPSDFLASFDTERSGVRKLIDTKGNQMFALECCFLKTRGRETNSHVLCGKQFCDDTFQCEFVHIHPLYWAKRSLGLSVEWSGQMVRHGAYDKPTPDRTTRLMERALAHLETLKAAVARDNETLLVAQTTFEADMAAMAPPPIPAPAPVAAAVPAPSATVAPIAPAATPERTVKSETVKPVPARSPLSTTNFPLLPVPPSRFPLPLPFPMAPWPNTPNFAVQQPQICVCCYQKIQGIYANQ